MVISGETLANVAGAREENAPKVSLGVVNRIVTVGVVLGEMVVAMDDLANSGLKRFEPCARLRSLARMNGHFHAPHAAPATANAVHS